MLYLLLYGLSLYCKQLIYRVYEARTGHQERQWLSVSPTSSTLWCAQEQASHFTVCLSITVLVLRSRDSALLTFVLQYGGSEDDC